MMRSLFAGVSGLRNHQTRMDVIGNNIANVNTTGFKASRVNFQDILSQTMQGASQPQGNRGGTNPMQVGLGVGIASIDTLFTPGSYQTTGKPTDLSIQDDGFFILANGNQRFYTRAGNFDFDVEGNYLVPGTGLKVMGWMPDGTGVIKTNSDPTAIQIPVGSMMKAQKTSSITFGKNLSASATKTGTAAERIQADNDKKAADIAKAKADADLLTANNDLATANTAKSKADVDLVKATAAKKAADDAKTAIDDAVAAITAAVTAANTQVGTPNLANATALQTAAATAVAKANAAVTLSTTDTASVANQLKTLVGALKTAADAAVANPTDGPTATNAQTAATSAETYGTTTAQTTANTAANNAATIKTGADAAATLATSNQQGAVATQQTAALAAATAKDNAEKAAAAVKAAYDESSNVPMQVSVYDSQGNLYNLSGNFMKNADNTWTFTPSGKIVDKSGKTVANVTGTPSTIKFDANGEYDSLNTIANSITIDPAGGPYSGAGPFTVNLDFAAMKQFGSESTAKATGQDGWTDGTLNGVSINSSGIIVGSFTNGKTKDLARVALAVFNNPAGLIKNGSNMYSASNNSGLPDVGESGTGGRGTFSGGTLEMSNVDLAQEFSNMIITQRGFQANSKIITTTDEMLEQLANLKR